MAQLSGSRVLVTGGTSGLGRAMAHALTKAGARVAVTSRDRERAQATAAELGAGALGVELDVRDAGFSVGGGRQAPTRGSAASTCSSTTPGSGCGPSTRGS